MLKGFRFPSCNGNGNSLSIVETDTGKTVSIRIDNGSPSQGLEVELDLREWQNLCNLKYQIEVEMEIPAAEGVQ